MMIIIGVLCGVVIALTIEVISLRKMVNAHTDNLIFLHNFIEKLLKTQGDINEGFIEQLGLHLELQHGLDMSDVKEGKRDE